MRPRTRPNHEERIQAAIRCVVDPLDGPVDPRDRVDRVCFSRFHFHRVFQALTGETVGELVRRLRLERAATHLRTMDTPITELAFEGLNRSSRHKSGIAVRFPRILRWRTDKPPAEADSLDSVRAMLPPEPAG